MTKYIVITAFKDSMDKGKLYEVGESYPKPSNKKISKKRLNDLCGNGNKAGFPLIEKVEEVEEAEYREIEEEEIKADNEEE